MKYKTTAKELRAYDNGRTFKVGYCDLQYLLYCKNANAYTCGVYGWNFDVYELPNRVTITTGYRNMVGKRVDFPIIKEYDGKARLIVYDCNIKYEDKVKALDNLIEEFTQRLIAEE